MPPTSSASAPFSWGYKYELHCVTRTHRIQSHQRKCGNGPAHSEKAGRFYLLAEPFRCPTIGEPLRNPAPEEGHCRPNGCSIIFLWNGKMGGSRNGGHCCNISPCHRREAVKQSCGFCFHHLSRPAGRITGAKPVCGFRVRWVRWLGASFDSANPQSVSGSRAWA